MRAHTGARWQGSAVTDLARSGLLLPADNVQAYVPGDRRRALAAGTVLPERVHGAALFADISGFTPLTETLAEELGGERGAEEVTAALESVFGALLEVLERYGGEAIYFSGDAVTCWLDGDDGLRAAGCGLAMQSVMDDVGHRRTPAGRAVELRLKVAVAVGDARRFVVGDPGVQLIDVLAGRVTDALAEAESRARPGQVLLDPAALTAVAGRVELDGPVVVRVLATPPEVAAQPPLPTLPEHDVRPWLLPAVYDRLVAGHGEFLADLRPAVPLFLQFGGLDFDGDPQARAALDDLVVRAQRIVDRNGGNVLQLTLGDKGASLYAVFGAPVAHEDDAARACWSALELLRLEDDTAASGLSVGVGAGRLRSGTYGSAERRTFCCLGDAVNLAARLMVAAPPGSAWVSDKVRRRAGGDFVWQELPPLQVKGKSRPVPVAALVERRLHAVSPAGRHAGPMLGRDAELRLLVGAAGRAAAGEGQVIRLTAEAGLGKSRLLAGLDAELARRGVVLHEGVAPAFGARGSYGGWQAIVRAVLGVVPGAEPAAVAAHLTQVLQTTAPALVPRLPLLGALLGVELPDTPLTATFSPELRKTSLESLVLQYLEARRGDGLLVLALDDAQWLDALSLDLLQAVGRAAPRLPLLLLVSSRPTDGEDGLAGLAVREIGLRELDAPTALALLRVQVEQLTGHSPDEVRPAVLDRIVERAQGNPFHLEELLGHLVDRGIDLRTATTDALDLPSSLQRLVLTRIDDLAEQPRRTLKVASVAGRRFASDLLSGAYPDLGDDDEVQGHLADLSRGALVLPEPEPRSYVFRHAMTEEVAYASLPFATRSVLHDRFGIWLESSAPDPSLDLLAHHFGRGTDVGRKRDYLLRAGRAAQGRYANEAAVDYFSRVLDVVADDERGEVLRHLGAVLELRGAWARAEQTYGEALELARRRGDPVAGVLTDLAEVARKQGHFDQAADRLRQARAADPDDTALGRVLHLEGTVASQQGRYDEARQAYGRSLAVRERLGDRASVGSLLSNLAVVAEQEGDLEEALRLGHSALAVREEVGEPWAVCISRNNLGMVALLRKDFPLADEHVRESMRLAEQVGDLWMVAVGEHNLGIALRGLDEPGPAGMHFARALRTYVEHDDDWSLTLLVEDVVLLALDTGRSTAALQLLGAADTLRGTLAAPRPPALATTLSEALGTRLSSPDGELFVAEGASLGRREVVQLVADVCGRPPPAPAPLSPV